MDCRVAMVIAIVFIAGCTERSTQGASGPDPATVALATPPAKLGLCVACHGEDGRSRIAAAPHLSGQNEIYLIWALNQYRAGKREGDVMNTVIGAIGERDIEDLAHWYAAQPCGESPPM